ncbi:MAG: iditol 2-dehydrogenase [Chloroflexi bacterium]|jgi:threonine dehydrogenase-like Zn-dependent dehydrogenase|nr:iditol 2-dehydrogenase [Chloroflexota bacterium]
MRAAQLRGIGQLALRDLPDPVARPGHVVLRVAACGICGTDRHIFHGDYPSALPVVLGHEFAGVVVAASEASHSLLGVSAAIDPNISCGSCVFCRRGDVCLCPNRVALGVDLDGGLAELVEVPESQVYSLPAGFPVELGALCEPLACCLRALDLAKVAPGMSVAIVGGGIIGQLMVQLVRLAGATSIVLITRQYGRRKLAEQFGATATMDPRSVDVVSTVTDSTGPAPGGVDVAIECVGAVETFEQCVAMARRGGTVLVFGVTPQGETARISPFEIFAKELSILGSYLNPLTHGRAVELAASGRLDLAPLISHRVGLAELPDMLAHGPEPSEVKVLVTPGAV